MNGASSSSKEIRDDSSKDDSDIKDMSMEYENINEINNSIDDYIGSNNNSNDNEDISNSYKVSNNNKKQKRLEYSEEEKDIIVAATAIYNLEGQKTHRYQRIAEIITNTGLDIYIEQQHLSTLKNHSRSVSQSNLALQEERLRSSWLEGDKCLSILFYPLLYFVCVF